MGLFQSKIFLSGIPIIAAGLLAGCEVKGPTASDLSSTGSLKNVKIAWTASRAKDVGLTGGGYKVYVHLGSMPTTANTTPTVIANPGGGVHTTTATVPLASGRYFVSVSSYSANGDSTLSTASLVVVP